MKAIALEQLHQLAGTLTVLRGRVREAVAGEVGKAVAEAVSEVLTGALGGRLARYASRTSSPQRSSGYGRSDWEDEDRQYWVDASGNRRACEPDDDSAEEQSVSTQAVPAALAFAFSAGRWWLLRQRSPWSAAGVALAVGGAMLTGGPITRTVLGVLWTVQRLVSATEELEDVEKLLKGH